jgi:hypothetical protein
MGIALVVASDAEKEPACLVVVTNAKLETI